jgi:hypothetical protein
MLGRHSKVTEPLWNSVSAIDDHRLQVMETVFVRPCAGWYARRGQLLITPDDKTDLTKRYLARDAVLCDCGT